MKTIVYQSQSTANMRPWIEGCLSSVERWANGLGADYQFLGDALFDLVPDSLRSKFATQPVVLTDLARLRLMLSALQGEYERALWLDADMLIFSPEQLMLPAAGHAVGREVWVQSEAGKLRAFSKVHNALLMATRDDSFLPFYADTAESLLRRVEQPVVPQFIGPKWLTAQHNISGLNVVESAGMLSPLALADISEAGGDALRLACRKHASPLAALNLSASYVGKATDGVCNQETDYERVVEYLLAKGLPK